MDSFNDNLSDSAAENQLLSTPKKNAKTVMKGTPPNKVVKRTMNTPTSGRDLKNSPLPKVSTNTRNISISTNRKAQSKDEIQPFDQVVLDHRAAVPPTPWKEIETLYRAAGGITTGYNNLKNFRYIRLKAAAIEVTETDVCIVFLMLESWADLACL